MTLLFRVVALLAIACAFAACRSNAPREVQALSGANLYQQLCASCHGTDARGEGPVASLIKIGVPDLTLIAHRDGGEFPAEDVRRAIDGRWARTAHGTRDMPVWGWRLYDISSTDEARERAEVDSMIDRLVEYLRSVQRP